jgi:hypothetical protein
MSARVLAFLGTPPVRTSAVLQVVEDDFSVKVLSEADDRFWVRVEKGVGDSVVVTDFVAGRHGEDDLIEALRLAVRLLGVGAATRIRFRDLVPGSVDAPRFAFRLEQATEIAKRAAIAIARDAGRSLASFKIERRGEKMDALASVA